MLYGKKYLLVILMFLGVNRAECAAPPSAPESGPSVKVDWTLRFEQLNTQSGGSVDVALRHFCVNYLICSKLEYLFNFITDCGCSFKEPDGGAASVQNVSKSHFWILYKCPALWRSVFTDNGFIRAVVFALKIYICRQVEVRNLATNPEGMTSFLQEFSGDICNMQILDLIGKPQSFGVEAADVKRFLGVMLEVFENEGVKSELTRIFGLARLAL